MFHAPPARGAVGTAAREASGCLRPPPFRAPYMSWGSGFPSCCCPTSLACYLHPDPWVPCPRRLLAPSTWRPSPPTARCPTVASSPTSSPRARPSCRRWGTTDTCQVGVRAGQQACNLLPACRILVACRTQYITLALVHTCTLIPSLCADGTCSGETYTLSGTSMACPSVSRSTCRLGSPECALGRSAS